MVSERIARERANARLYLQRARWHAQSGSPPEALADFTRAVELDPTLALEQEDIQLLLWRGAAAACRGDWPKASADFARVAGFPRIDADDWYVHALVLLHRGDMDGYKKTCADMYARFEQTEDRNTLLWLARGCVLAPQAVGSYDSLQRRLERAVADTPRGCMYLHPLGAVLYRTGNMPAVIRALTEAIEMHKNGEYVADRLFLAMAYQRQGKSELARIWLAKAGAAIDRMAKRKPSDVPFGWINLVELRLLRRETEAPLRGEAP
jgi:tetratricopeptide (TPR) repeat protein